MASQSIDKVLLNSDSSDEFIRRFMSSLVIATKTSNELPVNDEFAYLSSFKEISSLSNDCSQTVVQLVKKLIELVSGKDSNGVGATYSIPDDFSDPSLYEHVKEVIDFLLERADFRIDAALGKLNPKSVRESLDVDKFRILRSKVVNMEKPQLKFYHEIDNARNTLFVPRLQPQDKLHAKVPLDLVKRVCSTTPSSIEYSGDSVDPTGNPGPVEYYVHPYETELRQLRYPEKQMERVMIDPLMPSDEQPFECICTEKELSRMIDELLNASEIAVDLENHSFRSFQGFSCLMQISSRTKDYVIDVLELRPFMKQLLAVFANPQIAKIFHGCESDILWMQRDYGLYVVNCFDTFHAAKTLKYPALSLSHLVKYHCGRSLDKQHQLADWRVRPLAPELLEYAKMDTHYLLFIYDCMRRELWETLGREGVETVLDLSRKTCLKTYSKDIFWPLGYRKLLNVGQKNYRGTQRKMQRDQIAVDDLQDQLMAELWNWRDLRAREEDESPDYIMSNAELLRIAKELCGVTKRPVTVEDLETCAPLTDYVRGHASDVIAVAKKVLELRPSIVAAPLSPSRLATSVKRGMVSQVDEVAAAAAAAAVVPSKRSPSARDRKEIREAAAVVSADEQYSGSSMSSEDDSKRAHSHSRVVGAGFKENSKLYGRALKTPNREIDSPDTVCNFVPVVFPRDSPPRMFGNHDDPVLPVLSSDELYNLAGWKQSSTGVSALFVGASPSNSTASSQARNKLMEMIETEIQSILRDAEAHSSVGPTEVAIADSLQTFSHPQPVAAVQVDYTPKIPQSLEEIYEISNRNRRFHKDKKRGRSDQDGGGNDDESVAGTVDTADSDPVKLAAGGTSSGLINVDDVLNNQKAMSATNFDVNVYFACAEQGSARPSDMMAVARSVGWVGSEAEAKRLLDQHELSQSQHPDNQGLTSGSGSSDMYDVPSRSSETKPGHGAQQQRRRSGSGDLKESKGSSNNSNNNSLAGGKDDQQQRQRPRSAQSALKPKTTAPIGAAKVFDYSRLPQGVGSAVGALPSDHRHGPSRNTGPLNTQQTHHHQQQRQHFHGNPYVSSGGGGTSTPTSAYSFAANQHSSQQQQQQQQSQTRHQRPGGSNVHGGSSNTHAHGGAGGHQRRERW